MPALEQLCQQAIKNKHLAARSDKLVVDHFFVSFPVDGPIKQERV